MTISAHEMIEQELTIANDDQQDATILVYLFLTSSTCFGRCLRPSPGALDCIYSF